MALIDSHAHLDSFGDGLDEILVRARAAGVSHLITIGASDGLAPNEAAVRIAEAHPHVWAVVGIHPHDARLVERETIDAIQRLSRSPKVVAIGEMGLDYHYNHSTQDVQKQAFRDFLELARAERKPVVIHTREADDDTVAILREARAQDLGGVIHCFTGGEALAKGALELGFYLSFSGVLTFKNAEPLRAIARWAPRDRVLVETDCPYLAPIPHRGKKNEPAFVVHTAQALADVWGTSAAEVHEVTAANTARLFGLPPLA
jgi:TatD DNase family protein